MLFQMSLIPGKITSLAGEWNSITEDGCGRETIDWGDYQSRFSGKHSTSHLPRPPHNWQGNIQSFERYHNVNNSSNTVTTLLWRKQVPQGNHDASRLIDWLIFSSLFFLLILRWWWRWFLCCFAKLHVLMTMTMPMTMIVMNSTNVRRRRWW